MNNLISYFDNITALSNPIQNVIPRVYVDYKIIFPNLSSAKGFLKQIEKSSKNITTNVVTLNSEEFDPYNPMVEIAINCYSGVVQNLEAVSKDWSREYRTIKGSKPINNFAYTEFLEIDLGLNKISNEVKSELVENMLLGLTIPYLILHYDYPDYSNISNGVLIHIWHEFRTNKFQLTNVKNIALEGLTFKELPINARRAFSGYLIDCTIVECSPENPLYQQFLTKINPSELNISNDINSLWINGEDRLPIESEWFIGYVKGVRVPLRYNVHNQFWVDNCGKTYKPNEIDKWLNA